MSRLLELLQQPKLWVPLPLHMSWMPLHKSPGPMPLLRLQELLQQQTLRVLHKSPGRMPLL